MASPHRRWQVDLALRAAGVVLCGLAYLAIARLAAMGGSPRSADVIACGFAAISFVGASAGGAMTILGRHLFDRIEVSRRWRHCATSSIASPLSRARRLEEHLVLAGAGQMSVAAGNA